ncbi:hypothetical protein WME77_29410 [Sorangium sp. So ce764]|uniref:P-loop ATPase, Sll1717 family n=1 Tax=Sorangium sp. So ce764 TaxID=3133320 RepID=UPI003F62676D
MISLKELLSLWGFSDHPFESYTAEKEARLTDYFVSPPYLDDVLGTARTAAPVVVFGARGIGKSAIRVFIEDLCSTGDKKGLLNGRVVAVTHDSFRSTLVNGLDGVTLEMHIEAILQKMVCAALAHIAHRLNGAQPTKELVLQAFPSLDVDTFARLVASYYINLSDLQREAAFRGVYDYFKRESESISDRARWFQSLWSTLRVPIFDIANMIQVVIRGKPQIKPAQLSIKFQAAKKDAVLDDFQSLALMSPQLEIDAWYVLVDKVDEDELTDNDASQAAHLIMPLLKNLRVLETPMVSFKFFLWDQLRDILSKEGVRFDKIRNFRMDWTRDELRMMIDKRVSAFSNGGVSTLAELAEQGEHLYPLIVKFATFSPREIAHVVDEMFREHARHSTVENGAMITPASVEQALDQYCVRRVKDMYPSDKVRQFARLTSPVFTSSDVQAAFRISQPNASKKINAWREDGYVKQIEDTRSMKDASKTVYQYEVSEPRIRRIIERGLMSVDIEEDTSH